MLSRILKKSILTITSLALLSCSDFTNDNNAAGTPNGGSAGGGTATANGSGQGLNFDLRNPNDGPFSEGKMLANVGLNVIFKNTQEFSLQTALLRSRVERFCQELEGGLPSASSEKAAQDQWVEAMLMYHQIDAAPIGPILDNGRFLMDHIYSWPHINTCGIDGDVAMYSETSQTNLQLPVNRKGLGALEYLLFESTYQTRCNLVANPRVAAWVQKSVEQKKRDRCQVALALSSDLVNKARQLEDAWSPEKGNYTKNLVDGSIYETHKKAVNEVLFGLYSAEKVKDARMASPLGLDKNCQSESQKCPEMAEHVWSGIALKAIAAQLTGFRSVFFGASSPQLLGFGFDDYMIATDASSADYVKHIENALNKSISHALELDATGLSMQQQIEAMDAARCKATTLQNQLEPLCGLFEQMREVTTALKTEVLTVLSLEAPATYQGDND